LDIQPYDTTQHADDKSVLNIGGFSDTVFETVSLFLGGGEKLEKVELKKKEAVDWVSEIKKYSLV
jgi:60 kDa SS-A/Ro ribonucleoprotein